MDEVITASKAGTLREAFGAGTAAVVVPIDRIHYLGQDLQLPQGGNHSLCQQLYQTITELQFGVTQDNYGWSVLVD
jgi:branched-chain amino acid aminotransferase